MGNFKKFLNEKTKLHEAVMYNITKNLSLSECVFRRESEMFSKYFDYLRENTKVYNLDSTDLNLLSTDIGHKGLYEDSEVWLDLPFVEDSEVIEDSKENPCWDGYIQVGTKKKNGKTVPNCVPKDSVNEEDLNSPKRNSGDGKKYYVYVKNDKGNVVKINFGDEKGGLTAKINDPEARKAFAARHNCDSKNDKMSAGYWSCRLPWYAKNLGLTGGGKFWW